MSNYHMRHWKYALDGLFTFMLFVVLILFVLHFFVSVPQEVTHTAERIDFFILGGYYAFFFYDLHRARNKLKYFKKHWLLVVLLALPLLPIARLARFAFAERAVAIGINTIWHVFDEIGLL